MESIKGNVKVKNIPAYVKTMETVLARWAEAKKVKTGDLVVTVTIEKPFRPRTTGYKSQNHALNGYIQQICMDTGQDFGTTKNYIKQMAIGMGYPRKTRRLPNGCVEDVMDWFGNPIGISESDASVQDCSLLIECAVQLASELGIRLNIGEIQ